MEEQLEKLKTRVEELENQLAATQGRMAFRCLRKRSAATLFGIPLYDIAMGPDLERGERRGHARGIIAIGDLATGVVAIGGLARGVFALGGMALGLVSLGGCSVGLGLAVGGLALGGLAIGGCAVGMVAVGGLAIGYYACGGGAFGAHVINAQMRDPEAVRFFDSFAAGMFRWPPR